MIKAKFQQRRNGVLYKKGDIMKGLSPKQEAQAVLSGLADWHVDEPEEYVNMSNTKDEIKAYMDRHDILYTTDMTKQQLLDKIGDYFD